MPDPTPRSRLPKVSAEQRRAAAGQYERANQVLKEDNLDYAIQLLLSCCKLDPVTPVYRQTLRKAQKAKYNDKGSGQALAFLSGLPARLRLKKAGMKGDWLRVLDEAEQILFRNPWDLGAQLAMAEAFEALDLPEMALWTLDQARLDQPNNPKVNRPMARLYEKRGQFTQAMALWDLVRKANPGDQEAASKHKDLAAQSTIAKGKYEEAIHGQSTGRSALSPMAETAVDQQPLEQTEQQLPAYADRTEREARALRIKIDNNPTNANGYLHLANLYRRADRFDQARAVLEEGLGATGAAFELAMELVDLDIEPFRRDLALTEARLAQNPDDAELQAIRARLTKEIQTRELDYFRRKADRFPTDGSFKLEMGVRLLKTGQVDEAIRELQALRGDPRLQGKVLVYLGFCFNARKNWRLAQRNFEEALKHLGPGEDQLRKEILFQLATGYAETGDFQRAVDTACELANLDFGYKDIGKRMDDWTARLQRA
ncbi:MAG: tetratricopeptide repeat protein [Gemmataceae bacterium]